MATSVVQKIANAGGVGIPVSLTASTGATTTEGILLGTTETATVGAQKWSPSIHFQGSGWKTAATAGAQSVDYKIELRPIQGTNNPTASLAFSQSINGGTYVTGLAIASGYLELNPNACQGIHDYINTQLNIDFLYGTYTTKRTNGAICFTASNPNTPDTGIHSPAPTVISVGTQTVGDFSGTMKLTSLFKAPLTVATLPAGATRGYCCIVTDASNPTFLATVVGGASTITPVFYDGAAWKVG